MDREANEIQHRSHGEVMAEQGPDPDCTRAEMLGLCSSSSSLREFHLLTTLCPQASTEMPLLICQKREANPENMFEECNVSFHVRALVTPFRNYPVPATNA